REPERPLVEAGQRGGQPRLDAGGAGGVAARRDAGADGVYERFERLVERRADNRLGRRHPLALGGGLGRLGDLLRATAAATTPAPADPPVGGRLGGFARPATRRLSAAARLEHLLGAPHGRVVLDQVHQADAVLGTVDFDLLRLGVDADRAASR